MAAADTCCMRGGWDLSFLDSSEAMHLQHLHFSREGDYPRRVHRGPAEPRCSSGGSSNPLASVVRRGSNRAASPSSPKLLQEVTTSSGSSGSSCRSPDNSSLAPTNSSVDDSLDHIYQNQATTSHDDALRSIASRGVGCRSTTSSTSSSSEDDQPTSTSPSSHHRLHAASARCSFLQTPSPATVAASVCRSSRSPVTQTALVFPPPQEGSALALLNQSKQTNGDAYARVTLRLSFWDDDQLATALHRLSLCNFYLGKLSFDDAKSLLRRHPVGTFLLRDSSDDRYPFALSVQTRRGVTSIRIVCECGGRFRLDCEPEQEHLMPSFDCVVALVQFYVRQGERRTGTPSNLVLQEMNGRKDLPVLLRRPYETSAPSLAHLCRKTINGIMGTKSINRLQLLPSLKDFLNDYPYDI